MFSTHEVTVEATHEEALARLTHLINWGRLRSISDIAYQDGLDMLVRVGPLGDLPGLSKLVRVRMSAPIHAGDTTTVPLRWEATGVTGDLFPALDADLTLTPDGDKRCRLTLIGSYRPPLGRAGVALDRAILGRVATATIRTLLEQVAVVVSTPLPQVQLSESPAAASEAEPLTGTP